MIELPAAARDNDTDWWRTLPLDRVTRLHGSTYRSLAESVDPLPPPAPAVTFYSLSSVRVSSAPSIVGEVVDALESAAVQLTSLWLPDAGSSSGSSLLDRHAARLAARRVAASGPHFGPYLAALADAAVVGSPPRPLAFPIETRAEGAAGIIAAAHGRDACALVVDVTDSHHPTEVATAAEWLCAHGRLGVWLTGTGSHTVDRFPTVRVAAPAVSDTVSTVVDRIRPLGYPPVEGSPHPGSVPETTLYRMLDASDWATGREHNRSVKLSDLSQPFTVDVLWRAEKVVVEIDGDEHRAAVRFWQDRLRDNQLQTHGYVVLRFTNAYVVSDPQQVVAAIRRVVTARRSRGN
ncbi:hypothetical protein CH282_00420 [Rhodococcus sp. 06-418-1B]|nr:DUF559 domain-containing protein [Rhodococcus sp. 06-418-1B]OZC92773.1 hypothetical protein CH282_00420 [Rhodococcus sp. 06-418-1B]